MGSTKPPSLSVGSVYSRIKKVERRTGISRSKVPSHWSGLRMNTASPTILRTRHKFGDYLKFRMKFALLISALVASALAAPKTKNELTCTICVNFITDTTTEDQIVQFFKEICHTMGTVMGSETLE